MTGQSHIRGGFILPTLLIIALGIGIWQLTKHRQPQPVTRLRRHPL